MNTKPPQGGGSENLGTGSSDIDYRISAFLGGEIQPHELPWEWWLIWSDGFRAGCDRMQPKLDRANRDADWWYYVANNPSEVRAEHERRLKHFDVMQARRKAVTA